MHQSDGIQRQKRIFIWFCLLSALMASEEAYSQNAFYCGGAHKANLSISAQKQNCISYGKCVFLLFRQQL